MDYVLKRIERIQASVPKYFHAQLRKQMLNWFLPKIHSKYNFVQKGGDNNIQREFIYPYKGYEFRVFIEKSENDILVTVRTHEDNPSDCVIVAVDLEDRNAILQGLSYDKKCTKPYIEPGKGGGSILLKYILGFIKVNRNTLKIDRLILQDNAKKDCQNCTKKLPLSDLYFLMNNDTWYGKYGFRPFDKNDQVPHARRIAKYIRNQEIIKRTKAKHVDLVRYMKDAITEHNIKNIDIAILGPKLEQMGNESLSSVIKILMKTYDAFCCIFVHIIDRIYKKLGLHSFFGDDFYIDTNKIEI